MSEFILLDDPGISGFSGSVVLQFPKNGYWEYEEIDSTYYRLIGLISSSISDKNAGGGFTAIVPCKYILETVDSSPKFNGKEKIYHISGSPWSEKIYINGRLWNVLNNFDNAGKSVDKGTLIDGNGSVKIYNEIGNLIQTVSYKNGIVIK